MPHTYTRQHTYNTGPQVRFINMKGKVGIKKERKRLSKKEFQDTIIRNEHDNDAAP